MAEGRKEGIHTALLLLEILKRIPKMRKVTATELQQQLAADGLERDVRSIQRHLETLIDHFDIECDDRAKPYGYRWKERAEGICLPSLTPKESLLLKMAHEHLRELLPPKLNKSMEGFFQQAERNLGPDTAAKRERAWLKKIRVVAANQPLLPPEILPTVLDTVADALFENHLLEVVYKNASGKTVEWQVMPLGLAQQGPRLYLVCRFKGYDDNRILALNRIKTITATSFGFEYPKDFDLGRYVEDGGFGCGNRGTIRLTFRVDKNTGLHITESPLSTNQTVIEHEDCYEIHATVVDTARLEWWLNGFGENVWDVTKIGVTPEAA